MATGLKSERLKTEALAALALAKGVAEKADNENREMTEAEATDFRKHFDLANSLNEQRKAALSDEKVLADAKALADSLGLGDQVSNDLHAQAQDPNRGPAPAKSLGDIVVASPEFTAMMKAFGDRPIPEKARVQSDPIAFDSLISRKALFVGGTRTGSGAAGAFLTNERSDIFETLGRRPLRIRDLVSVRRTGSDTIEYVVQTAHTNAAAVVPEATSSASPTTGASSGAPLTLATGGGYKPEGSWSFDVKTTTVRTIAEWVPATKRALADVNGLAGLINDELVLDLAEAEEDQILNGNGSGQNFEGILQAVTQTQAYATNLPDTFRKALTKVRTVGRAAPSAIVLNPVDVEKFDMMKDTTGRYMGSDPFGNMVRAMWGVPVVESEAMPAGTGLIGDFSKAVLWDREQANISVTDSHADFFIRNLVAILAEERLAFAVTRPSAFVEVTGIV